MRRGQYSFTYLRIWLGYDSTHWMAPLGVLRRYAILSISSRICAFDYPFLRGPTSTIYIIYVISVFTRWQSMPIINRLWPYEKLRCVGRWLVRNSSNVLPLPILFLRPLGIVMSHSLMNNYPFTQIWEYIFIMICVYEHCVARVII